MSQVAATCDKPASSIDETWAQLCSGRGCGGWMVEHVASEVPNADCASYMRLLRLHVDTRRSDSGSQVQSTIIRLTLHSKQSSPAETGRLSLDTLSLPFLLASTVCSTVPGLHKTVGLKKREAIKPRGSRYLIIKELGLKDYVMAFGA